MKVLIAFCSVLLLILIALYVLRGYRSAFEADQACHAEKWEQYNDSKNFGCDHDLETKQWILYEVGQEHMPARVVKRFRY